jgi:hypothetical protein
MGGQPDLRDLSALRAKEDRAAQAVPPSPKTSFLPHTKKQRVNTRTNFVDKVLLPIPNLFSEPAIVG